MKDSTAMLSNEQIAHDLALLSVRAAMDGKSKPLSDDRSILQEYRLRYKGFLSELNGQPTD